MGRREALALVRVGFAVLTLVAIAYQLSVSAGTGRLDVVNFFSYFTILSNLLAAAVLLMGAARSMRTSSPTWDLVRGQAVVVMTVTLVVFALLLADTDVDVTTSWVDTVVHRLFPAVVILDWLVDPPASAIGWRRSVIWLAAPLVWLGYTMVRGALTGWYPYPFLDPADGGYGPVAVTVAAILAFGVLLCVLVAVVGDALRSRRLVPMPSS